MDTMKEVEKMLGIILDNGSTILAAMATITCCLVAKYVWKLWTINKTLKVKQLECRSSINKLKEYIMENGISDKKKVEILGLTFTELQAKLQNNSLLAEDVLKAYQSKALEVHEITNCIVEPIQEAMNTASGCDLEERKGLLHGIPISIKENYYVKGYDSTGGICPLINKPAKEDGVILKVLKRQGAVPFVRTNLPQFMMTFECSNPIYGTTVNYHNLKRGPGGSSGGEGALLAGEGSILGWGSDIGGSLRIPSQFSGVTCLKPTVGRISLKSTEELVEGQKLIQATCGPMARDVDTLVTVMKAVLCPYHWELDPTVVPIPFRTEMYECKKPLRIGYYDYDGSVQCIPGVRRGLQEAKEALEKMGHTLVQFTVPRAEYMFTELFVKIAFGDGGIGFTEHESEDFIDPQNREVYYTYCLPSFVQKLLSYPVSYLLNDRLPGKVMRSMQGVKSVSEWWKLSVELEKYKSEFLSAWKAINLDAMISPTMPYVAVPTGCVKYLLGGTSYTTLYNLLNYPAGCVPVTKVTAIDQKEMKNYPSNTSTEKSIRKYFSSDTGGLPVAVQCIALPFKDEITLRVMKELETGLKKITKSF